MANPATCVACRVKGFRVELDLPDTGVCKSDLAEDEGGGCCPIGNFSRSARGDSACGGWSSHIEGTQLSVEQAEQLWAGRDVSGADADDVRELLNYRAAFDLVSEYLSSGAPISEGLLREIHKRLVDGVRGGRAMPGEWRSVQNFVANSKTGEIIYTPPPAAEVPALMRELVEWLRDEQACWSRARVAFGSSNFPASSFS